MNPTFWDFLNNNQNYVKFPNMGSVLLMKPRLLCYASLVEVRSETFG